MFTGKHTDTHTDTQDPHKKPVQQSQRRFKNTIVRRETGFMIIITYAYRHVQDLTAFIAHVYDYLIRCNGYPISCSKAYVFNLLEHLE